MAHIQVLDQITIDKIAAGEVIERPSSVVKELAENAIDAGASAVVVEIKEGGISFIRVTDNGCGIPREEVPAAFLRHSTSKIRNADDLMRISSLGFRGEALSSIAAVSQVELITKTREDVFGTKYTIAGGKEEELSETGAPDGTTFLIHQLFYNVPARRKFLKTPMTEASHVSDLITRLALSHPEVSFQFINNGDVKLHTSGNGSLKDAIYHIYGREIASNLIETDFSKIGMRIRGYLGKPLISRGNRNYENLFVNGRYVKSSLLSKAVEDAYKDFTMQHKYPFVVLHMEIDGESIDVNVHPTKMDLRFDRQQEVYNMLCDGIGKSLQEKELIPEVDVPSPVRLPVPDAAKEPEQKAAPPKDVSFAPAADNAPESSRIPAAPIKEEHDLSYFMKKMKERVIAEHQKKADIKEPVKDDVKEVREEKAVYAQEPKEPKVQTPVEKKEEGQLNLFEERLLTKEAQKEHRLIGQVFETYWLVEFHDNLYIIDQHAAHERVLYERTLKGMKTRAFTSQYLSPPIILTLSMQEEEALKTHIERFTRIGFEIEQFGGNEYAVRAVPGNLFSVAKKELLIEMLDALTEDVNTSLTPDILDEKIASMSCKAAVKGNSRLSAQEMDTLLKELLELDNPYHCPHGRPTIIAMTKRELEKKFKRIV